MLRFCVTIDGQEYCFDIPVLYDPWWWMKGPGPVEDNRLGEFINWMTVNGKHPEWASELRSIATVAALARTSPALQKGLQAGIHETVAAIQAKLPQGVKIHFGERA
ncbi:MAG TPA: hypothetical protein VH988_31990 [Thermoanaerobaculia bacterium]|nr:hypothetical protein [Thermoanaerobaculia bacterium]